MAAEGGLKHKILILLILVITGIVDIYKFLLQKLYESFQDNQYPTREKKESLGQELGLTYRQVCYNISY